MQEFFNGLQPNFPMHEKIFVLSFASHPPPLLFYGPSLKTDTAKVCDI